MTHEFYIEKHFISYDKFVDLIYDFFFCWLCLKDFFRVPQDRLSLCLAEKIENWTKWLLWAVGEDTFEGHPSEFGGIT